MRASQAAQTSASSGRTCEADQGCLSHGRAAVLCSSAHPGLEHSVGATCSLQSPRAWLILSSFSSPKEVRQSDIQSSASMYESDHRTYPCPYPPPRPHPRKSTTTRQGCSAACPCRGAPGGPPEQHESKLLHLDSDHINRLAPVCEDRHYPPPSSQRHQSALLIVLTQTAN